MSLVYTCVQFVTLVYDLWHWCTICDTGVQFVDNGVQFVTLVYNLWHLSRETFSQPQKCDSATKECLADCEGTKMALVVNDICIVLVLFVRVWTYRFLLVSYASPYNHLFFFWCTNFWTSLVPVKYNYNVGARWIQWVGMFLTGTAVTWDVAVLVYIQR